MSIGNLTQNGSPPLPQGKPGRVLSFATWQKLDPAATERRRRDRERVRAILSGDPDSFARLHALYATPLFRFAVKRLGDANPRGLWGDPRSRRLVGATKDL